MTPEQADAKRAYARSVYLKKKDSYRKRSDAWRAKNRERTRELSRIGYRKNIDSIREKRQTAAGRSFQRMFTKRWRDKNPERVKQITRESNEKRRGVGYQKEWRTRNKKRLALKHKLQMLNDPQYAISRSCRNRVYVAMSRQLAQKSSKTIELTGCTWKFLREYIESKFSFGMTWGNRGEWHIDHIRPCDSFDLTDVNQQRQCFHYTNLQPLWALDNLRKGSNVIQINKAA